MDLLLDAVVTGVLLGCFYAAVSIGLSVSFGLLDVPHVAHPAFLVLASYGVYFLNDSYDIDPLGYYLAPFGYASGQLIEQAIKATGSLDQKGIAKYLHENEVKTIVGPIAFSADGERKETATLQAQFRGVTDKNIEQFRSPGKQVILFPDKLKSGDLITPFEAARK